MSDKKPELSAAMKSKVEPKVFKKNPIIGTKFTIAISSAKGGVGKSTFATNLALALKTSGCKVGLLDADIYGPSIPKMFGIDEKPKSDGQKLEPILKYDIQCMSIGFLTDQQTPMIWRGPMVTSAIKTFTQKVNWKDLDFIIVDMPPGTGDTQLTFSQEIKMDGAIIVSTPQEVALLDVKRGIKMFDKLKVPYTVKTLGVDIQASELFTIFEGKGLPQPRTAPQIFIGDTYIGPTAPSYGTSGPVSDTRYFAGGGGSSSSGAAPDGGGGGAANGGDATVNTGGGGAGGRHNSGNGGSGIVMIRYKFQ